MFTFQTNSPCSFSLASRDFKGCVVIVDSTGLKVYSKDEWRLEKHEVAARRAWRKLRLAVDVNHQKLAC